MGQRTITQVACRAAEKSAGCEKSPWQPSCRPKAVHVLIGKMTIVRGAVWRLQGVGEILAIVLVVRNSLSLGRSFSSLRVRPDCISMTVGADLDPRHVS